MQNLFRKYEDLEKETSTAFIETIKNNEYDSVWWDIYSMNFSLEDIVIRLWIGNNEYGLEIKTPQQVSFTIEQKEELYELVSVVKLTNKIITFKKLSNDLFWKYNCICGNELSFTGYDDTNWWEKGPKTHELTKCKCGLTWKVNLKSDTASMLYKDYIKIRTKKQIEIEAKKQEEYEKAKEIVNNFKKSD